MFIKFINNNTSIQWHFYFCKQMQCIG